MSAREISLRGVRVHNLQNIDLDIPHGQLLVCCGLSGSGKSSLAFDTLYAEGQRRYIESLSPYTRQFLDQLEKPDADRIDNIPPAIAVRATRGKSGNRATVGTSTEIVEYLRLLFAKIAKPVCFECDSPISKDDPQSVASALGALPEKTRFQIAFGTRLDLGDDNELKVVLDSYRRAGFSRAVVGNRTVELDQVEFKADCAEDRIATANVIVDRLAAGTGSNDRVRDSLETAFEFGHGSVQILIEIRDEAHLELNSTPQTVCEIDGRPWSVLRFNRSLVCGNCQRIFPEPEPRLFSFNSPMGACPACEGFGQTHRFDMERIVPDPTKSIRDGAIAPWNTPAYQHELQELLDLADDYGIQVDVPFSELPDDQVQQIWDGVSERDFGGLTGFFQWLERRKYKMHLRVFLSRWRTYERCETCRGGRLNSDALAFQIDGKNLAQICGMKIADVERYIKAVPYSDNEREIAGRVIGQVTNRIEYLCRVGLQYLSLDRTLRTLSGGETQRVALTSSLGSQLVNMLYVLDEPSVGLHAADVERLTQTIQGLNDRGNTVVVVDHEEHMIRAAERVVEIGPEAGSEGGEIVFDGSVDELIRSSESLTGQYLAGHRGVLGAEHQRRRHRGKIKLVGASGNNLQNVDVEFPLGCLCIVSGVSGSGKSSLVQETLYGALCRRRKITTDKPLPYCDLIGDSQIDEVVLVDQSPIGRSPRSNPVTYVKAFDEIRKAFAETIDAKTRNFKAGHFSFNVEGGRCNKCQGDGMLSIDMQFMADIYMRCDECRGTRYRQETLKVRYRGKNIHEVLNLTVRQAFSFFRGQPKVQSKLKALIDVGLEYVRLGQSATTLSSGEAQRLKLALYLNSSKKKRTLFLLDEPTSGLHMRDVVRLVDCFDALLAVGHSMIVVEHNLQLMKYADWIIDLGPGAADEGGHVVAVGTPEQLSENKDSLTGAFLKGQLQT